MPTSRYPGDEFIPHPTIGSMYSIQINALPDRVWPWLLQMGYHRAGWYIDAWWDRLIQTYFWPLIVPKEARGQFRPPADEILPQFQDLQEGDIVPDGPPGTAFYRVVGLQENRCLLLLSDSHFKFALPSFLIGSGAELSGQFSWVFLLDELDGQACRLALRFRGQAEPARIARFLKPPVLVADYLHVREMLKGIRRRVERQPG